MMYRIFYHIFFVYLLTSVVTAYHHRPRPHPVKGNSNKNPVVTTPFGKIQGAILKSRLGKDIYAFRAIRYAKAPLDDLRFQPPVPVDDVEGIYNATVDGPVCPQPTDGYPYSEDCLFLNVYSTKLPKTENDTRPVIFFLHPGGFYVVGTPSVWYGPQYYLDQDIVLVTINYRLASLGFLSTGTKEAPGNLGLKDQVVALKFVKRNIRAFGGDPNRVTLVGYSAGSISVLLHTVSPMSQGLFNNAIAMSASPTPQSSTGTDLIDLAKKQARFVGCPDDTPANIVECLKKVPAEDFVNTLSQFAEFGVNPILLWTPVVEKDFGQERFLVESPTVSFKNGNFKKVPIIIGQTRDEFSYLAEGILSNATLLKEMNDNFEQVAPICFQYERGTEKSRRASAGLRSFYFNNKTIDKSLATELGELFGDSVVGFGVNRAAKLLAAKNTQPVYYYRFNFEDRYSFQYTPESNYTKPFGVTHHDDLMYLFYISVLFPPFNETTPRESGMIETLTGFHTNFAKYGNPTPKVSGIRSSFTWEPYTIATQKYLDISDNLQMQEKLYEDRYSVWNSLFPVNDN